MTTAKRFRCTVTVGDHTTRILVPHKIEDEATLEVKPPSSEWIINRAIEKIWGRDCFWWADSGLGVFYGQVCRPVPQKRGGGNNCLTSRVRADISDGW